MSTGKRRANWEKVLEERMNVVQMLISNLNMDRLNQITDLQNQVDAIKKKSRADRYIFAIVAVLGVLTAVLK